MDLATPEGTYELPEKEVKVALYQKPKMPKPYSAAFHLKGTKLHHLAHSYVRTSKRDKHPKQDSSKVAGCDRGGPKKNKI